MLISEIIKEEESNLQNIFFHKEGLFWRAYEHSAYQVVTHLKELKVIKKCFKVAGNKEIVFVGVPEKTLSKITANKNITENADKRITIKLETSLIEDEYNSWKNNIQLVADKVQNAESNEEDVKKMIKNFNVAASTPIDCMLFLTKIQNMI